MTAWSNSTRRRRLPKNWSVLVHQVKLRDGYRCTWTTNGTRCTAPADDIDHIHQGDDHSLANLRCLCKHHHTQKTNSESQRARGVGLLRKRPPVRHPGLKS